MCRFYSFGSIHPYRAIQAMLPLARHIQVANKCSPLTSVLLFLYTDQTTVPPTSSASSLEVLQLPSALHGQFFARICVRRRLLQFSPFSNSTTALGISEDFIRRTCPSHFKRLFCIVGARGSHFAVGVINELGRSCPLWSICRRQRFSKDCKLLRSDSLTGLLSHPYRRTLLTHAL